MKIYNVQINPELAQLDFGQVILIATNHARERADERRMYIPLNLTINKGMIVECEADGRVIKKLVVRRPSLTSKRHDDVFVLFHFQGRMWSVLSCYQNTKEDTHQTLNTRRVA